jgi:putative ABC transport system ATP-binding protein
MIYLKKVNKTYHGLAGPVRALIDVDLTIHKGESLLVVGKSGSGKSTLLNVISGIDRAEEGVIEIDNADIGKLSESDLAQWRGRNVGIVFQSYQLIPTLSVLDNVVFPMDLVGAVPRKDRKTRAESLLSEVGLEGKSKKYPTELSGGEAQRVAIARAMANDPAILIADEPTGNLDSKTGEQIYQLFKQQQAKGKNLIVVTHELNRERSFDRVVYMQDGKLLTSHS